jgi:hypothetical protein
MADNEPIDQGPLEAHVLRARDWAVLRLALSADIARQLNQPAIVRESLTEAAKRRHDEVLELDKRLLATMNDWVFGRPSAPGDHTYVAWKKQGSHEPWVVMDLAAFHDPGQKLYLLAHIAIGFRSRGDALRWVETEGERWLMATRLVERSQRDYQDYGVQNEPILPEPEGSTP